MLLQAKNLSIEFPETGFKAVNNIDFKIEKGEILGLVGESGSGKSLTALSILGLCPPSAKVSGEIVYNGQNLQTSPYPDSIRGNEIALIPQDPLSSLNPMYSIANQIYEAIKVHSPASTEIELYEKSIDYLERVGIPDPARVLSSYPHEISGGMRQRVMIAMAIINEPKLLIADEPTTALDVTVQAIILKLLKSLNKTILFITHDFGVIAEIADRVLVMRFGEILEVADVFDVFEKPENQYTKDLLGAIPKF